MVTVETTMQPVAMRALAAEAPAAPVRPAPAEPPAPIPAVKTELVEELPVVQEARVTISGCLQRDDEGFRLRDTVGEAAPKSRSWKSAFLKKRSASLELVDVSNRAQLPNHVGERVSVTGVLQDREVHVHSVRRVAASCEKT